MIDSSSALQRSVFTNGRGHAYFAETPGLPLSLKCMFNGRARYRIPGAEFAVDDGGYLILNDGQPYSIEIASPTQVETFVLWFPEGWTDEVFGSATLPNERLLEGEGSRSAPSFFQSYTPHDGIVSPKIRELRAAFKGAAVIDDQWLEERLRQLLAAMLKAQGMVRRTIAQLPAVRASTRDELWRRVNRARDFLHAHVGSPISLGQVADVACLSPFHLLRTFQAAFRQTPHQYLQQCRLERAKFLLEKTKIPVTAICLDCGFSSLGSFSALFHKQCGMSPRAWRASRGLAGAQNSKIEEVYLTGPR